MENFHGMIVIKKFILINMPEAETYY